MVEHLAVVGVTGAVGREVCKLISERALNRKHLSLFASGRSAGSMMLVDGRPVRVRELKEDTFAESGFDYAIFCAGGDHSRQFTPTATRAGAVVIDTSSAFRMAPEVPLVVPEINADDAQSHHGLIAGPNCSTTIMNVAVWPLHRVNPVERIVVSTYQAVSGAGVAAMEELRSQTADFLAGRRIKPDVFPHQTAFNLFSHDTPIGPDGYNSEERKMVDETRKIFHEPSLAITATCIRVPVLRAHSESINLTFERPMTPNEVRERLSTAPGVEVVDDTQAGRFPMPVDASGKDACLVGRIRQDVSQPDGRGIELFVCGDQLRKGAALNAIQILELIAG